VRAPGLTDACPDPKFHEWHPFGEKESEGCDPVRDFWGHG
jgi:hypothetical protein